MDNNIQARQKVYYVKDCHQQTGIVQSIKRDVSNGQPYAIIEVEHHLDGITHTVPLQDLKDSSA